MERTRTTRNTRAAEPERCGQSRDTTSNWFPSPTATSGTGTWRADLWQNGGRPNQPWLPSGWASTSEVLDIHDGELMPTLENRRTITRLIRDWKADIVIAHRPWDYHPDHRYVGVLVQDAAFMVTVPHFLPSVPALKKNPVFLYSSDRFQKPYPFEADIAVDVGPVFEKKVHALTALVSQTYEGGALGSAEIMAEAPPESKPELRAAWLKERWVRRQQAEAKQSRDALIRWYGEEKAKEIEYAEAFEICEYGRQPDDAEIRALFPFLPPKAE